MQNNTVLCIAALIAIVLVAMNMKSSEESYAKQRYTWATDEEKAKLGGLTWQCQIWSGCIVKDHETGKFLCRLPDKVENMQMLNYQLGGRLCELEPMQASKVCKTPGYTPNPYGWNPSAGYYYFY